MKNKYLIAFTPFVVAGMMKSCTPSSIPFPGDDPGNECTIDATHMNCRRIDAHTVEITTAMIREALDCNGTKKPTAVGVTISAPGGISHYKGGKNGIPLGNTDTYSHLNPTATFDYLEQEKAVLSVHTNKPGDPVTIEFREKELFTNKKKLIDIVSTEGKCDYCVNTEDKERFKIDNTNHCAGFATFYPKLCEKTYFSGSLSLGGMSRGNNGKVKYWILDNAGNRISSGTESHRSSINFTLEKYQGVEFFIPTDKVIIENVNNSVTFVGKQNTLGPTMSVTTNDGTL